MAVIGNAPFQGLVSGGNIIDASIEGVDLSTSAIAARLGYTPVDPGAAVFSANPTISSGTANGVAYLNGSKVVSTSANLTFDGTDFALTSGGLLDIDGTSGSTAFRIRQTTAGAGTEFKATITENTGIIFDCTDGGSTARSFIWTQVGSEAMRLTSTGLGIGLGGSNPSAKLHVKGTEYAQIIETDSTTDGDAIRMSLKAPGAQSQIELEWWNDSTKTGGGYGLIQTGKSANSPSFNFMVGSVGIGTISPSQKFHVANAGAVVGLVQNTSGTADARLRTQNTQAYLEFGQDATGGYIQQSGAYPIIIYQNASGIARFDANGNFLVGGTLNNSYKAIISTNSAGTVTNTFAIHNGNNYGSTGTGSRLLFKLSNFENAIEQNKFASIEGIGVSAYNEDTALVFRTQSNANRGNLPTEKMRLDYAGWLTFPNSSGFTNYGIKASGFGYSPASYGALVIGSPVGGNNTTVCINVDPVGNTNGSFTGTGGEVMFRNGVQFITPTADNTSFYLNVLNMSNGNVGVGMSPTYKLDITGRVRVTGSQSSPSSTDILPSSIAMFTGGGGDYLTVGQYTNSHFWIQGGYLNPSLAKYDICLQPLGGKVGVGTSSPVHTLDVNGSLGVKELYSRTLYNTSGGNLDLTEYTANNFVILEVFGYMNPNSGGSSYRDPIHMYIYAGWGWNGSNLTNYIYVQHVAPLARDMFPSGGGAGNAIAAVWYDGSTESDSVVAGSTSHYVRLKIYNYNSNYGSDVNVRVIRRA